MLTEQIRKYSIRSDFLFAEFKNLTGPTEGSQVVRDLNTMATKQQQQQQQLNQHLVSRVVEEDS